MTLRVPFDGFIPALRRAGMEEAYVSPIPTGCVVTAADPKVEWRLYCRVKDTPENVWATLEAAGIQVYDGIWEGEADETDDVGVAGAYIGAVSYETEEIKPGLWIDAFHDLPTQVQVLRCMYDEFKQTGETGDVTFEEFVRMANPTVLVLSPADLRSFLIQKSQ